MRRTAAALLGLALAVSCAPQPEAAPAPPATAAGDSGAFRDVTAASGLDFVHDHGGTGRKYLPEIMGSGGAALDYDGDGWTDLYLVQSGPVPGAPDGGDALGNRLYRNLGDGTFADVTAAAGAGDPGYGQGVAAADYDDDGDTDLYVANLGADALLRNNGDGTFSDVTAEAGIASPEWGSSATFFDADLDGDLDLYVVNYLDFTVAKHVDCGRASRGVLSYCHPDVYEMAPDRFFRNRGDGSFEEATRAAGLLDTTGKGLGVVAADMTGDGWPDLYVANDSTPNFLYQNLGDGTFEEAGLLLGVGYNEEGLTEAGMGTDIGDVNGDGRLDLFVTNLSNETNALYLGGAEFFTYETRQAGLYAPTYLNVGFGTEIVDLDNDGDPDLVITNGHVIDNIELIDDAQSFRQPSQLFVNDGHGRFSEDPVAAGDLAERRVGRGTISLDADRDGRVDIAITFNHDHARLFRNELAGGGSWLGVRLGADAGSVGAVAVADAAGRSHLAVHTVGSSYQTTGEPRLHYGLGEARAVDRLTVRWPAGGRQAFAHLPTRRDLLFRRP